MADFYSHSECAKRVIKTLNYDFNDNLVFVGAQGPDPLYYNAFGKEAKDYRYFADRMHDTSTQRLLINMTQYVKQHNTKDTYSYLIGFISHYALDVKIHPYIYYKAGIYQKEKEETHKYRGLHLKFERSVDCVLIEENTKKKAHKHKLYKSHFGLKQVPKDVAKIIGYTLKQTYGKDDGTKMFRVAVQKMYRNLRYLAYDPLGIKKQLLKFADLFHNHNLFYQDVSLFDHIEDYDYLNKDKKTWHHPITNEASNQTVYDLLEEGYQFALEIISKVNDYLEDKKDINLEEVFTNLSFNSGIDCRYHDDMKYFDMYRK